MGYMINEGKTAVSFSKLYFNCIEILILERFP